MPVALPGLVPLRQAAVRLGINYETLRYNVYAGNIPCCRIGGKVYVSEPVMRTLETGEGAEQMFPFRGRK